MDGQEGIGLTVLPSLALDEAGPGQISSKMTPGQGNVEY